MFINQVHNAHCNIQYDKLVIDKETDRGKKRTFCDGNKHIIFHSKLCRHIHIHIVVIIIIRDSHIYFSLSKRLIFYYSFCRYSFIIFNIFGITIKKSMAYVRHVIAHLNEFMNMVQFSISISKAFRISNVSKTDVHFYSIHCTSVYWNEEILNM